MKLKYTKDEQPLSLPNGCLAVLADADAADLRVLLHIAACEAEGGVFDAAAAAAALQLRESEVRSSVKFWRGAGVLCAAETAKKESENKSGAKKPLRQKRVMHLGADELAALGERDRDFRILLDMAQQTAGWIFNTSEIEILAALYSSLGLSGEYILALIGYFVCRREKPLRYLEKVAYAYTDKGITTAEMLEEKLRWLERFEGRAGKIRSMFGIGARDLTEKEEAYLTDWFDKYSFADDVIRLAYEKTVDNTGKASLSYANSILKAWHEEGIKTTGDVQAKAQKSPAKQGASSAKKSSIATQSFNVDDALQKALERSYNTEEKK